jgi:hypothetical protein
MKAENGEIRLNHNETVKMNESGIYDTMARTGHVFVL